MPKYLGTGMETETNTLSHDWTNGCMVMTNRGMDMVWSFVNKDTVVEIRA